MTAIKNILDSGLETEVIQSITEQIQSVGSNEERIHVLVNGTLYFVDVQVENTHTQPGPPPPNCSGSTCSQLRPFIDQICRDNKYQKGNPVPIYQNGVVCFCHC